MRHTLNNLAVHARDKSVTVLQSSKGKETPLSQLVLGSCLEISCEHPRDRYTF